MFYAFSRFLIRLALPIYLKRLFVINFKGLPEKSPLLIASNHAGSFFDALVIGAVLKKPIHTLTRGDVFKKASVAFWLRQINLIPVFRGSEGRQYVKNHDVTTQESHDALLKGDSVVVFSEGICVQEWNLRPLGKGTARMAHQIWFGEGALPDMKVIPTGMNYEHFRGPGKRVMLRFGNGIHHSELNTDPEDYEKWLREFNEVLDARMKQEVLHIPADTPVKERQKILDNFFGSKAEWGGSNFLARGLGWLGRLIHWPLYSFLKNKIAKLTARTVFYDSALFGLLVYIYPLLVTLLALILTFTMCWQIGLAAFVALPVLAWFGGNYR